MREKSHILVVDDDPIAIKTLSRLLSRAGHNVFDARTGRAALSLLSKNAFDLVMADLVMEEMSGLDLLKQAKLQCPEVEFIVVTGYASIPTAIEAMKNGAYHYLEKPFRQDEILHLVDQALEKRHLKRQVKALEAQLDSYPEEEPLLLGESRQISDVVKLIKQVACTDCNVVLTGESGTGKELAAAAIHYHSDRKRQKFLAINCGGFTEELLANELFGHDKGAFTGAGDEKAGLLETASGGTLLLDEVGDMPLSMQVKLLRAVEEQTVIKVGGNRPIPIDLRFIAATNQDLKKAVAAGLFRQDLYYRLNVISISVPPLRERRGDIPLLALFFLNRASRRSKRDIKGFSDQALELLADYSYPGNVRELENIVERAVAMAQDDMIQAKDLPPDLSKLDVFSIDCPDSNIRTLQEIDREYIQWVLNRVGRNKTAAAKLLGIDRTSLWRHLKRHEIRD
jgi:DNA-binding NtrC family response regulator